MGIDINLIFDAKYYLRQNPDVAAAGVDPLSHFLQFGQFEGRNPSVFFNKNYYLSQNPDVAAAGVDPFQHFLNFGINEGRDFSPFFDADFYLSKNNDVLFSGVNPLKHFLEHGLDEGRIPTPLFDKFFYKLNNPDLAGMTAFEHFLEVGIFEHKAPSPLFVDAINNAAPGTNFVNLIIQTAATIVTNIENTPPPPQPNPNAAPVVHLPSTPSTNEEVAVAIQNINFTDADSNLLQVTLSTANGTLQVNTSVVDGLTASDISNNGTSSVTFTANIVKVNNTLADANGLIFTPTTNFNGNAVINVSASDGSVGSSQNLNVTVNNVNDAPVNTVPGAQSTNENTSKVISGISITDIDSTSATVTLSVAHGTVSINTGVAGGLTAGDITNNGTGTVTITGNISAINATFADASGVTYTPTTAYDGPDTLTVNTNDGSLSDSDNINITVINVNNPPVNSVPGTQLVTEDTPKAVGVGVSDDGATVTTTISVSHGVLNVTANLPGGLTAGQITGNGTNSVILSGNVSAVNTTLGSNVYSPNANFDTTDTLVVHSEDSFGETDIDNVTLNIDAVNDDPTIVVPGSQTTNEDTAKTISGISVGDVDNTSISVTLTVSHGTATVVTNPNVSITGNGSNVVVLNGTVAGINAILSDPAAINYVPTANYNGSDTLLIQANDGVGGTHSDTVGITVTSVDDAPVNTAPGLQTTNEDTAKVISGLSVADIDHTTLSTYTLSVSHGIITLNTGVSGGVTAGEVSGNGTNSVTISGAGIIEINATLAHASGVTYTPANNYVGSDTLTVIADDGTLSDSDNVGITVNAVNDAPVNTIPGAQTTNEDTAKVISGISVTDVDNTTLSTYTLTVTNGVLTLNTSVSGGLTAGEISGNGTNSVTVSGATVAAINATLADASGLTYNPTANFNGSSTLTVDANDGSLSDSDNISITVNSVNDAPINSVPGAQTASEDTNKVISGISVSDIDNSSLSTYTLTVSHGTITLNTGVSGGINAGQVSGNGTNSVTISGATITALNNTFADGSGVTYLSDLNYNGSDTLTVQANDGTDSDSDNIGITVNAVNDAPVNTVPGAQTANEDANKVISGISVSDVDNSSLATYTLSVSHGTITLNTGVSGGLTAGQISGNGTNSVTISSATVAAINNTFADAAGITYLSDLNYNGSDTISLQADDGALSDSDNINITVNATNDAPTVANSLVDQNGTEGSSFSYQFASNSFDDIDVGDSLTYSATLVGGGALPSWLTFTPGTRTFSGTPGVGDIGTINVQVTATDTASAAISDDFQLVVGSASGQNFTLTGGNDNFVGFSNNDTFTTSEANLSASDTLTGAGGTDRLVYTNAAALTSAELANKTSIEIIELQAGGNSLVFTDAFVDSSGNDTVEIENGTNTITSLDTSAVNAARTVMIAGTGAVTLANTNNRVVAKDGVNTSITGGTGADTIIGGTGNDTITNSSGSDSMTGGNGNDVFNTSEANFIAGDTIGGGAGTDTLTYTNAAALTAAELANKTGFEIIQTSANGNTFVFTDAFVDSSENDTIEIANGTNTITSLDTSAVNSARTVMIAGTGAVTLAAGVNNRVVAKDGVNTSITGGTGADTIIGGTGADTITTSGTGSDSLSGGNGNDNIRTTEANFIAGHTIDGGAGTDTLTYTNAAALSSAELANKTGFEIIQTSANGNTFVFTDAFVDSSENDTIEIANGTNTITSLNTSAVNSARTVMIGGTGAVTLAAGVNNRVVAKDGVNTSITGGTGADTIIGGTGNDTITNSSGSDSMTGGSGADVFSTSETNLIAGDTIDGGAGTDTLTYTTAAALSSAELANKTSIEIISASAANGNTFVFTDAFVDASGNDTIEIANGTRTVTSLDTSAVNAARTVMIGGTGAVTLGNSGNRVVSKDGVNTNITGGTGVDTIIGGTGNDSLTGGSGNDTLVGSSGTDTLSGGNNDDTLVGGTGGDVLTGGANVDTFKFAATDLQANPTATSQIDRATDWVNGTDKFMIENISGSTSFFFANATEASNTLTLANLLNYSTSTGLTVVNLNNAQSGLNTGGGSANASDDFLIYNDGTNKYAIFVDGAQSLTVANFTYAGDFTDYVF